MAAADSGDGRPSIVDPVDFIAEKPEAAAEKSRV
jgi:hypothetical protein